MPERLPEKNARQGFFETDEFERLLPHLPPPINDMARLAFLTDWRRGEVVELTWDMVDRTAGEIRLPDTKNGKPRTLPLDEEFAGLIERRWLARQYVTGNGAALSAFVFHRQGRQVHRDVFLKQWKAACRAAELAGKLFHDFRRTAARNLIRGGVPQSVAMRITGHETDSMFRRYDIASSDDKLAALRAARPYAGSRKGQSASVVKLTSTK